MIQAKRIPKNRSQGGFHGLRKGGIIQPKLEIGQPDDKYEREADAVADKVMMMPDATDGIRMKPAMSSPDISMKCTDCEREKSIQMQPEEEEAVQMKTKGGGENIQMQGESKDPPANTNSSSVSPPTPGGSTPSLSVCRTDPVFPDFGCFIAKMKQNLDENLWNYGHHFYRIASLYPDQNQLLEDAFFRYGPGLNFLETTYRFLGASPGWATGLSYGTGVGLKTLTFLRSGELTLDFQVPLNDRVNLDLSLDLRMDPNDLSEFNSVQTGIGISGHF